MIGILKLDFKRISFYSLLVILSSQTEVLSQPSFTPDNTPKLPICDYSVIQGAQKELNKLVYDYELKRDNEDIWGMKIRLKEADLIYDASKYYNCDLKYQLDKPIIIKKPYLPYIPRY